MKKFLCILATAAILVGGTMNVKAYDDTFNGVQCYCTITGEREVMAYTAVGFDNITVIIHSKAYDGKDNLLASNGNAGGGYASTRYNVGGPYILYAIQEHEVPLSGFKKVLTAFPNLVRDKGSVF